ncbi:MAG: histidine phosphatase family protein [Patescibacteria group bacterium]
MQKVFLIRHGEVENPDGTNYGTLPGWHLSQEGRGQIKDLSLKIKDQGLNVCGITASPLERAQETAAILSQNLAIDVTTDKRLTEWDMGDWMGKPLQEFYQTSGYYSPEMKTDGMEPLADLASRMIDSIRFALTTCAGDIIICSHREPMAAAIIALQQKPWPQIHEIDMPMASVWELIFENSKFQSAKRIF